MCRFGREGVRDAAPVTDRGRDWREIYKDIDIDKREKYIDMPVGKRERKKQKTKKPGRTSLVPSRQTVNRSSTGRHSSSSSATVTATVCVRRVARAAAPAQQMALASDTASITAVSEYSNNFPDNCSKLVTLTLRP